MSPNPEHKVKRYGKVKPHTFRDTFASRLVQGKRAPDRSWLVRPTDLSRVQKLLGHPIDRAELTHLQS